MFRFSQIKTKRVLKTFVFGALIFLGVLFPLRARAGVLTLPFQLINYGVSVLFIVPVEISNLLLAIAAFVLNWVLSPDFVNWNYTGFGATGAQTPNTLVRTGWKLTRDLTNMLFVIYLAFIGLATALRRKEYQAKKMLPKLLMIVLLINFTPVICGAIIDASNIITNFFLGAFTPLNILLNRTREQSNMSMQDFLSQQNRNPVRFLGIIVRDLALTGFNIIAAMVLGLFAFLFAARYVALWTLVILSPFAFFSYLTPMFKSFWNTWWKQFFQWCFVGVTGAFFLYLSNLMIKNVDQMVAAPSAETFILAAPIVAILQFIVPYGLCIGFLIFGLVQSLSSSAMFSEKAVEAAKWTGGKLSELTWERIKASELGEQAAAGAAEAPGPGQLLTQKGRKALGEAWGEAPPWKKVGMAVGTVTPFAGAIGRAGLEAVRKTRGEIEQTAEDLESEFESQTAEMSRAYVQSLPPREWKERIAGTIALGRVHGPQALEDLEEGKPGTLQKILKMMGRYRMREMMEDLVTLKPDLIMEAEEGEDLRQKLRDEFGNLHQGLDLEVEVDKKELVDRVKEKLSEMGNETGRLAVDELVWRGMDDENVTELMETGYEAGEALVAAAFKTVVEGTKPDQVSDLDDVVLKNPLFQELAARYQSKNFAREILDQEGPIRDQFVNTLNRLGAEELINTNESLIRWILYSWEGQARVGPIRGAETKEEYQRRSELKNLLMGQPLLQERLDTKRERNLAEQKLEELKSAGLQKTPQFGNLQRQLNLTNKMLTGLQKKINADEELRERWQEVERTEEELLRSLPIETELETMKSRFGELARKRASEIKEDEVSELRKYKKRLQELGAKRTELTDAQREALKEVLQIRREEDIPGLLEDLGY